MPKFQIELELSSINDRLLLTNFDSSENSIGGLTFNENLSEEENGLYRLTFSLSQEINEYPEIDISRLIAIGRPLWLQLYDPRRSIRMAITSYSPVIGSENIIYEIEAQDYASYTFSRNNAGLTLNTFEDEEFLDWLRLYGKTTMNFLGSFSEKPDPTPTPTPTPTPPPPEPTPTIPLPTPTPTPDPAEIWSFVDEYPGPTLPINTDQSIVVGLTTCTNFTQEDAQEFIDENLNPSNFPVGYKVEVRPMYFTPSSCSLYVFEGIIDPDPQPEPVLIGAFARILRNTPAPWYLEVFAEWESLLGGVSGTTIISTTGSLTELTTSIPEEGDFRVTVPSSVTVDNSIYNFVRWRVNSINEPVGQNQLDIFVLKGTKSLLLEAIYEDIAGLQ